MKAGFARIRITPKIGTPMEGFSDRDAEQVCDAVHDHLFVRALYLEHLEQAALIIGLDVLFLDCETVARYKRAIGRELALEPRRILLNTSHTHAGPRVNRWHYGEPDSAYLETIETAMVEAAAQAQESAREATIWAGETRSTLPLNRRKKDADDAVIFAPDPQGPVCDALPICLIKDEQDVPISLLFSVSCHPSTIKSCEISADYPGVAMARLDEHLGAGGSLFLQGAGGDAKPSVIGMGGVWHVGDWHDVTRAGLTVAREVITKLAEGLFQVEPRLQCASVDMRWPLVPPPEADEYQALLDNPASQGTDPKKTARRRWAEEQLARIRDEGGLPEAVDIGLHGIQVGNRVRLIGLEGEPVAELGLLIREFYVEGVTFPLGCTDGAQLYLPTSEMLYEGGYEVTSYFEYHQPSPLAKGVEHILRDGLDKLRRAGVR